MSDITPMTPQMRTLTLINRWSFRSTQPSVTPSRTEVCPPSLRHAPAGSPWQRLMYWLMAPSPAAAALPPNRLPEVRADFLDCLNDIAPEHAQPVQTRIDVARSLRDLWHLRAEVYRVVSLAHSQAEASQRVAGLNRHFPTRAPRSQFAPL